MPYLVSLTKPKKADKRVVLHWAVYLSFKLPLDSIYHNSKIFYIVTLLRYQSDWKNSGGGSFCE